MGLILCTKKAKNPYILPETDKKIYCIEELCYYIYNNTYMITADFFTKELIEFIDKELGMGKLAQKLKHGVDYNDRFSDMIMYIMNACHYYNGEEKSLFHKELEKISSKSPAGRIKARADMLLSNKKYNSAIAAYSVILEKKDISYEPDYFSDILNNMAIAYVNMFEYKKAMELFESAYNKVQKEDYLDNLMCAAILNDDAKEIENLSKKFGMDTDSIEKYKKVIDFQTKQIAKSKEHKSLEESLTFDLGESLDAYKKQVNKVLYDLREEYRKQFS